MSLGTATKFSCLAAAHGRRKSAVANAIVSAGTGQLVIRTQFNKNDALKNKKKDENRRKKSYAPIEYFETIAMKDPLAVLLQPLLRVGQEKNFDVILRVKGGGIGAQLDAAQLAIAKALAKIDPLFKQKLGKLCHTDARQKERGKIGHRGKARRKVQYSKR